MSPRDNRLVRLLVLVAAILLALIGAAVIPFVTHDANYATRLRQRVTTELPIGLSEAEVDRWLRINTKYFPTRSVPPRIDMVQGRGVIELAGISRGQVASVVCATVPREDAISKLKEDYVRVYFFFDAQGKLIGKYFLSWNDIVRMEQEGC